MLRHSKQSKSVRQPEHHEFQFRGTWLPPRLLDLLAGRDLPDALRTTRPCRTDVLVYLMVDALSKTNEGCYASNDYLAKNLGLTKSGVNKAILRLKAYGLIKIKGSTNKRRIRTFWDQWDKPTMSQDGIQLGSNYVPGRDTISNTEELTKKNAEFASQTSAVSGVLRNGLVAPIKPNSKCRISEADLTRSDRLRKCVVSHGWKLYRAKSKWGIAFAELRDQLGSAESKIDAALDFICSDQYKGKPIFHGRHLKNGWPIIEEQMQKHAIKNPTVTITPKAAEIQKHLHRYKWPERLKNQLPAAIQLSLDNYTAFYRGLQRAIDSKSKLAGLANHLKVHFGYPQQFVLKWFRSVEKTLMRWADFKGSLIPTYTVAISNTEFRKQLDDAAASYGRDWSAWLQLLKEIES